MKNQHPVPLDLSPFSNDDDADEIACWPQSLEEARAWAGKGVDFPLTAENLLRWHDDPDVHPFVGRDVSGILMSYGELWLDRNENEIELSRIIVEPSHRGRGIGRLFVDGLLERADVFDLPDYCLRVLPDNLPAIRCYEAAGFEAASAEKQTAWNLGQPASYLWYTLSKTGARRGPESDC